MIQFSISFTQKAKGIFQFHFGASDESKMQCLLSIAWTFDKMLEAFCLCKKMFHGVYMVASLNKDNIVAEFIAKYLIYRSQFSSQFDVCTTVKQMQANLLYIYIIPRERATKKTSTNSIKMDFVQVDLNTPLFVYSFTR